MALNVKYLIQELPLFHVRNCPCSDQRFAQSRVKQQGQRSPAPGAASTECPPQQMEPHNEVTKPKFTLNVPLVYSAENNASQWIKENNVTTVTTVLYTELLYV